MLSAEKKTKLYEFYVKCASSKHDIVDLWQRLGHLNFSDMKKRTTGADGIDHIVGENSFCEPCVFGNRSRKPLKPTKNKNIENFASNT